MPSLLIIIGIITLINLTTIPFIVKNSIEINELKTHKGSGHHHHAHSSGAPQQLHSAPQQLHRESAESHVYTYPPHPSEYDYDHRHDHDIKRGEEKPKKEGTIRHSSTGGGSASLKATKFTFF